MKKFAVVIFLLVIVGCQAVELERLRDGKNEPIPTSTVQANHHPISVDVFVPEQVEVIESFTIDAELKNTTEHALEIITGDPVFYYIIRDSTGKAINTITRTDVGVVRTIDKKEVIAEKHPYRFENPGIYDISAVTEFTLSDGDNSHKVYKIETEPKKTQVLEN